MAKKKTKKEVAKKRDSMVKVKKIDEADKHNKQLAWILAIAVVAFLAIVISYQVVQDLRVIDYKNLKFEKIKYGTLDLFHLRIPIIRADGTIVNYNLYLRTDPRKNSVNITDNSSVRFSINSPVYISSNSNLGRCEDYQISILPLSQLIGAMNLEAKAAINIKSEAIARNVTYLTCDNAINTNAIVYLEGNETKIYKGPGFNCYIVEVADCNILEATEKLDTEIIADGR